MSESLPLKYPASVNPGDPHAVMSARVPVFDNELKSQYLQYRACNFGVYEAAELVNVDYKQIEEWRRHDPMFRHWDQKQLALLQGSVSKTILEGMFLRCMVLTLQADMIALNQQVEAPEEMTADMRQWARGAATRYKAADFAMIQKVVGEDEDRGTGGNINLQVNIGQDAIESELAHRASARDVLNQFTRGRGRVIDVEARVVNNDASAD